MPAWLGGGDACDGESDGDDDDDDGEDVGDSEHETRAVQTGHAAHAAHAVQTGHGALEPSTATCAGLPTNVGASSHELEKANMAARHSAVPRSTYASRCARAPHVTGPPRRIVLATPWCECG